MLVHARHLLRNHTHRAPEDAGQDRAQGHLQAVPGWQGHDAAAVTVLPPCHLLELVLWWPYNKDMPGPWDTPGGARMHVPQQPWMPTGSDQEDRDSHQCLSGGGCTWGGAALVSSKHHEQSATRVLSTQSPRSSMQPSHTGTGTHIPDNINAI